ncbi:MAG: zinc-binding dehydrogenase [Oligoflexia bacterium]|nr:zinc-binding dehydrogenase [Oligoflexia bacterium]
MKTTAAILVETGRPLEIDQLEVPALKPGQVLVEIKFSGVCHTQILEARGHRGKDNFLPHCLGHEGAGVILEIGPAVSRVKTGDRVLLSWIKGPGMDIPGTVYGWKGKSVNAGAIATFSQLAVISENRTTKLPENIEFAHGALMGCAVPTGLGAVFNNAEPKPGQSLAVFGAGGVGLCAIAGAAIAGCTPVIAVDINPQKFEAARAAGATHCVNPSEGDLLQQLNKLCPQGLDFAIEATGRPEIMEKALQAVRPLSGAAVLIGNAHFGENLSLDPRQFNAGKQLRGSWGGGTVPERDFPRYFSLLSAGRLNLDLLSATRYALSDANRALDDLESGKVLRPLLDMQLSM